MADDEPPGDDGGVGGDGGGAALLLVQVPLLPRLRAGGVRAEHGFGGAELRARPARGLLLPDRGEVLRPLDNLDGPNRPDELDGPDELDWPSTYEFFQSVYVDMRWICSWRRPGW